MTQIFVFIANFVAITIWSQVIDPGNPTSFTIAAFISIIILSCSFLVFIPGSKESKVIKERFIVGHDNSERISFFKTMKMAIKQKNFMLAVFSYLTFMIAFGLMSMNTVNFIDDVLQEGQHIRSIGSILMLLSSFLTIPIWARLAKRIGHSNTYVIGLASYGVSLLLNLFIVNAFQFYLTSILNGISITLFLIMLSPVLADCYDEIDVKLITTSTDNTPLKAKLVAKFLEIVGRTDIPIGIGPQENHKKARLYPWIKDYELSRYPGTVHEKGMEVLCSTIMDSPEPLTLIAIGPLGTVAGALKMNPNITENSRFVGMHGSIRIGCRGSNSPHREYNVKKNIKACREVFQAPWEKTITPLETCGNIVLSGALFERIMKCDNLIVRSIIENFKIWKKKIIPKLILTKKNETSVLFDTVAIYLGFSEELLNIEELKIEITDRGLTQISKR